MKGCREKEEVVKRAKRTGEKRTEMREMKMNPGQWYMFLILQLEHVSSASSL